MAFLNPFTKYIYGGIAAIILCLSLWGGFEHSRYLSEKTGREKDKISYMQAQQKATDIATQQKVQKEKEYADSKTEMVDSYNALLSKYNSVLSTNVKGSSFKPNLSNITISAGISPGTSEDPFIYSDKVICAENTAKAQVFRQYILEVSNATETERTPN